MKVCFFSKNKLYSFPRCFERAETIFRLQQDLLLEYFDKG